MEQASLAVEHGVFDEHPHLMICRTSTGTGGTLSATVTGTNP